MSGLLQKLVAQVSAITVFTYFLTMAIILALLAFTPLGPDLLNNPLGYPGTLYFGAFLIPIFTQIRVNLLGSFLVLFSIYGLCFTIALKSNGGFLEGLHNMLRGHVGRRIPNWLVIMPLVSSALLLIVVAITLLQDAFGVPTGKLPFNDYRLFYAIAYAPPVEETMFRISTLGLIVAFRVIWRNALNPAANSRRGLVRLIGLSFLFPDKAKGEVGMPTLANNGWQGFHWSEWAALILTSIAFGLAHYVSNVGWEAGKILTAAISGFGLGLAFLAYGAYASILLHWFFNVYLGAYSFGQTLVPGLLTADVLIALLSVAVGIIGIVTGIVWLASGGPNRGQTTYMVPSSSAPV